MAEPQTTLRVDFVSESAGFQNSFGWYNRATGVGGVLFAKVESEGGNAPLNPGSSYAEFTVNTADVGNIEYFLIPDGGGISANTSSEFSRATKVIQLADGSWAVATLDSNGNVQTNSNGQPNILVGEGRNAFFTEKSKNEGGVDHASSTVGSNQTAATLAGDTADGATGLIAWEDLAATKKSNGTWTAPGDADYNDAVFRISIKNKNPDAKNDSATVSEDAGATTINVLANDTDGDGDTLQVISVNDGNVLGSVTIAPGGAGIVFNPGSAYQYLGAGESKTETFTYKVSDGRGGTDTATVTLKIVGANDAPVVIGDADLDGTVTERTDGASNENSGTLSTGGDIFFTDVDRNDDDHTVSVAPQGSGYLGTMTAVLSEGGDCDPPQVDWNFSVPAGALDFLAANQTLTQNYTVTISDGNGGTVAQTVTITLVGKNDKPVIGSAVTTGTVQELADNAPGENTATHTSTGNISFTDVDLADAHSITVTPQGGSYRGTLTAVVSNTSTGDGSGQVTWTYSVSDGALDDLVANQQLTQTYRIKINDGNGGTVEKDVVIKIKGAHDNPNVAPVITSGPQTGSVTERADLAPDENAVTHSQTGAITFSDVNPSDTHTASVVPAAGGYIGTLTLGAVNQAADSVGWTFTVPDSVIDSMQAGQTRVQTYNVTISDGLGGTASQSITITISGTNDAPTITSGAQAGAATEIADNASGENATTHSATGSVTFADVDTLDTHSATAAPQASGYLGTLTLGAVNQAGDSVGWSFSVADSALDSLQAGEVLTQSYDVTVGDGHGGTAVQTVTITLTGTNDAPVITSAAQAGSATESADNAPGENTDDHTASGAVTFADVDTLDTHSATFAAQGSGYLGTFAIDPVNQAGDSIGWTFTVNDAVLDSLAAGEVLTQLYDVTVDDAHGGTAVQTVTITITGTNDVPTIDGVSTGSIQEDVAVSGGNLFTSGVLTIADVDAGQSSFQPQGLTYGDYGAFSLDMSGNWTYTTFNGNPAIQGLAVDETLTDSFTAVSADGTASQLVTVTISGTNDIVYTVNDTVDPTATKSGAGTQLHVGSGIPATGFGLANQTDVGVELGFQVIYRQGPTVLSGDTYADGVLHFTVNDGPQSTLNGSQVNNLARAAWSFEYSIATGLDGNPGDLDDFTFKMLVDIDPTNAVSYRTLQLETGGTGSSGYQWRDVDSNLVVIPDDAGNGSVTQNSQNYAFYSALLTGTYGTTNNFDGPAQFDLVLQAWRGTTLLADNHIAVDVVESNHAPIAVNDSASVKEDVTLLANGNVLTNDTDVDPGDTKTVTAVNGSAVNVGASIDTAYGAVTINANGTYTYTLDNAAAQSLAAGVEVTESFTYTVSDADGATSTATLTVTISGTNDVPTIDGVSTGSIQEDVAVSGGNLFTSGALTIADVDAGQSVFQPQNLTYGDYGAFSLDASGNWTYTTFNGNPAIQGLAVDETLTDSFTAVSSDGTASQVVTVTISGTNDVVYTVNDTVDPTATKSGAGTQLHVGSGILPTGFGLANQTDVGIELGFQVIYRQGPTVLSSDTYVDGVLHFTVNDGPQSVENGSQVNNTARSAWSFQYSIATGLDGNPGDLDDFTFKLLVDIDPTNAVSYRTFVLEAGGLGSSGHQWRDTDTNTVFIADDAGNGSVTQNSQNFGFGFYQAFLTTAYGTSNNFDAPAQFDLVLEAHRGSNLLASNHIVVDVVESNDAPVAADDSASVREDVTLSALGNVLTNDFDNDAGDTKTVTLVNGSAGNVGLPIVTAYGTLTLNANGSYSYALDNASTTVQSLAAGVQVQEVFTYTMTDADGATSSASLTVTITGSNDVPTIEGVSTGSIQEDVAVSGGNLFTSGALTIADVDAGQSSFQPQGLTYGDYGAFSLDASGNWTYTAFNGNPAIQGLAVDETLTDSFTAVSVDGTASQVVTVTISGTNDIVYTVNDTVDPTGTKLGAGTQLHVGSGIPATGFGLANQTDVGVELGFQVIYRQGPTVLSSDTYADGVLHFTVNDGPQSTLNGSQVNNLARAAWSFEYSIATGLDGNPGDLDDFTFQLLVDIDPTIAVSYRTLQLETGGSGSSGYQWRDVDSNIVVIPDDAGNGSVTQNSQNYAFYSALLTGTYGTANNFDGPAQFDLVLQAWRGTTLLADNHIAVDVVESNHVPTAVNDSASVKEDVTLLANGNVLANDTDVDPGDTKTVTAVNGSAVNVGASIDTAYGAVTINANGTYTYTLDNAAAQSLAAGVEVQEVFTYTVTDADGATSTATLTVTVTGTNDAPVAADDSASGDEDTSITTGNVLTNDSDADGTLTPSSVTAFGQGANGTVVYNGDGTFTYTPDADFNGDDSFTYTVTDGVLTSTATVNVTVNAVNDAPVHHFAGNTGTAIRTAGADIDGTEGAWRTASVAKPLDADGNGIYGSAGYFIAYSGDYAGILSDLPDYVSNISQINNIFPFGNLTDPQYRSLDLPHGLATEISGVFYGFELTSGLLSFTLSADANFRIGVIIDNTNSADISPSALTLTRVSGGPATATESVDVINREVDYYFFDVYGLAGDSFVLYADNRVGLYQSVGVAGITFDDLTGGAGGSDIPGALSVNEDTDLAITGLSVSDVDAGSATITTTLAVAHGTLTVDSAGGAAVAGSGTGTVTLTGTLAQINATLAAAGNVVYRGDQDFNGSDALTIVTNDGGATGTDPGLSGGPADEEDVDTIAITVSAVNDVAVITGDDSGDVIEDGTTVVGGTLTVSDPDVGESFVGSVVATTPPPGGPGQGGEGGGADRHAPPPADPAPAAPPAAAPPAEAPAFAAFDAEIPPAEPPPSDGGSGETPPPPPPSSGPTPFVAAGVYGTLTIDVNGAWSYQLANDQANVQALTANQTVTDSFAVTSLDGTATRTITITIHGTNDAPVALGALASTNEDTATSGSVVATDVDDLFLTYAVSGPAPAGLTFNSDGTWQFDPGSQFQYLDVNETTTVSFEYVANDGDVDSAPATVSITISGVNDAPIITQASDFTGSVMEAGGASPGQPTDTGLIQVADVDDNAFTVQGVAAGMHGSPLTGPNTAIGTYGTFTLGANLVWTYTLDNDDADTQALVTGQTVTDSFTYTIIDDNGAAVNAVTTITVTGADENHAPVAANDATSGNEDTSITVNVLANDVDLDAPLTVSNIIGFTQAAHGTVVQNLDGTFTYTPNANTNGADSFTYTITDGQLTSTATVNLTVNPVNDAPTIVVPRSAVDIVEVGGATINVLTGDGTGNFTTTTVAAGGTSAALGDINGDGWLDVVTTDGGGSAVNVLIGNGSGGFAGSSKPTGGSGAGSVAVGDINGDGKLDIVTANRFSNNVSVLIGDGAGNFTASTKSIGAFNPNGVTLADINGDGKLDIITANGDSTVSVLRGDGAGNFTTGVTSVPLGQILRAAAVGDFNSDGKADIAVATGGPNIAVLTGDGAGNFTSILMSAGTAPGGGFTFLSTWSVAVGDVNADGKADIVTSDLTSGGGNANISVFLGNGAGSFTTSVQTIGAGTFPVSVALGDVNGDGKLDVVTANQGTNNISVLVGDGNGNFAATTRAVTGSPNAVVIGDINTLIATEDTAYVLSAARGNAISVADIDSGSNPIQLSLGVLHGVLALGLTAGLTVSGQGTGALTITGSQGDINAALANGLTYTPNTDYNGAETLSATVNDLGNSGAGGPLTSSGAFNFTITPVYDALNTAPVAVADTNAADAVVEAGGVQATSFSNVNLAALGTGGFKIIGEIASDALGFSVAGVGDINGDGRADLLIGARLNDAGGSNSGAAYVVFGKTDNSLINLDSVAAGTGGFKITGQAASDFAGWSVSGLGDVNGDGRADLLVGAYTNDNGSGTNSGAAYVVFGKADGTVIDLDSVAAGTGGFKIFGDVASDYVGFSVSGLGDVNGDGLADMLVGAQRIDAAGGSNAGAAYVVFGKADGAQINISGLIGGFMIYGENATDYAGTSVAGVGDVNGDGLADILVGAELNDPVVGGTRANAGAAYVVFGKASTATVNLDNVAAGTGGFKIIGQVASDQMGTSVSGIGDVNGDGLADLLVGADGNDAGGSSAGAAYVVFGKAGGTAIDLVNVAAGIGGFKIVGEVAADLAGFSVSGLGDINGDGRADLLVGAYQHDLLATGGTASGVGAAYVVFGKTDGATVNLSSVAAGTGGYKIFGEITTDLAGYDVAGLGDVNGDGRPDLLIGAYQNDNAGGSNAGAAYVVFGPAAVTLFGDATASGNVLGNDTDTDAGDGKTVQGVAAGTPGGVLSGNVGTTVTGTYGSLNLAMDGSYTYTLNDADPDTQALAHGQAVSDVFTYTMRDTAGATSTTTLSINITGSAEDGITTGGAGNDMINGGVGPDTLTGGLGNDTFVFNLPTDGLDTITDFVSGTDKLQINGLGFGLGGPFSAAGGVTLVTAADAASASGGTGGYFIFDNAGANESTLYFDATGGSGADAVALVKLTGITSLLPSDFHVV